MPSFKVRQRHCPVKRFAQHCIDAAGAVFLGGEIWLCWKRIGNSEMAAHHAVAEQAAGHTYSTIKRWASFGLFYIIALGTGVFGIADGNLSTTQNLFGGTAQCAFDGGTRNIDTQVVAARMKGANKLRRRP